MHIQQVVLKVEVKDGVVVTVVQCAHCCGSGSCDCNSCEVKNFGGYKNNPRSGPCAICDGSGTVIITKKV